MTTKNFLFAPSNWIGIEIDGKNSEIFDQFFWQKAKKFPVFSSFILELTYACIYVQIDASNKFSRYIVRYVWYSKW